MTRRNFVAGAAALTACSRKLATGFPGFALVASETEHSVSALSLERFRVTRQLALEAAPSLLMAIADPAMALCLLPRRGTVVAMDNEAVAIRQRLRVGDESLTMCLDPDRKRVWVLNRSPNSLVAIDLATFKPGARIRLPGVPGSIDVFGKMAAVTLPERGEIVVIEGDRIARTIATGIKPDMICFRPDGGLVMAADPAAQLLAVGDPASGELLVKLPLPMKPRRYCYKTDGGQLFITGDGMDAVSIVSPYKTEVSETILAGHSPAGMAVVGDYLFVTNSASGDVTVISIFSYRVLARFPVGQDPQEVLITPDEQYALVLNRQSGDVAVIRIPAISEFVASHNQAAPNSGYIRLRPAPLFTMVRVCSRPVSATITRI